METKGKRGFRGAEPGAFPVEPATALGQAVVVPDAAAEAVTEAAADLQPAAATSEIATLPPPVIVPRPNDAARPGQQAFSALAESRAAAARALEAISGEIAGLARSEIAAAARTAADLLEARTFADAAAVNALFLRRSVAAFIGGSAKISELAVGLAAESSEPIVNRLGTDWMRALWAGV